MHVRLRIFENYLFVVMKNYMKMSSILKTGDNQYIEFRKYDNVQNAKFKYKIAR